MPTSCDMGWIRSQGEKVNPSSLFLHRYFPPSLLFVCGYEGLWASSTVLTVLACELKKSLFGLRIIAFQIRLDPKLSEKMKFDPDGLCLLKMSRKKSFVVIRNVFGSQLIGEKSRGSHLLPYVNASYMIKYLCTFYFRNITLKQNVKSNMNGNGNRIPVQIPKAKNGRLTTPMLVKWSPRGFGNVFAVKIT